MPWTQVTKMELREQFIRDVVEMGIPKAAACRQHGISRPTGDLWLRRRGACWRDGTTHIRMAAAEFVLRLLALIPAPRKKQFRYLGVFAANAKWRREVVLRPKPPKRKKEADAEEGACTHPERAAKPDATQPGHALSRLSWSHAMRRTFKLDVLKCGCGGRREVIALIPAGEIATMILAHLRMPVTAAQFSSLTRPPLHRSKYSRAAGLSALRHGARTLAGRRRMKKSTGRSLKTTRRKRAQAWVRMDV